MDQSPRKSFFDKLETMNLVREIELRRGWVEDRLISVNLHPSLMHHASERLERRADEEGIAAKRDMPSYIKAEEKGTADEDAKALMADIASSTLSHASSSLSHRPASHISNVRIFLFSLLGTLHSCSLSSLSSKPSAYAGSSMCS